MGAASNGGPFDSRKGERAPGPWREPANAATTTASFPRKRESLFLVPACRENGDSRIRGNDLVDGAGSPLPSHAQNCASLKPPRPRPTLPAAAGCACRRKNVLRAGCNSPPAVRDLPRSPRAPRRKAGVSRSGVIPEPTVIVRMRENGRSVGAFGRVAAGAATFDPRDPEETGHGKDRR
jgi:hypothetical protein